MSSQNPPPWLSDRRRPHSNLPTKRSADSRVQERPSKRAAPSTTAQEEAWVADEDRFVLQQAKKKAALRVKGNRAKPIDWLAVTLRFVDPTKTLLDEEVEDHELDIVDSEGVIEGLNDEELAELENDIDTYLALETNRSNRDYWNAQKTICKDKRRRNRSSRSEARGTSSITSDIDRLLSPKSFEELETLEAQVKKKLNSDEPIDYDYWEQLLRNLRVWKAKAKLKKVSQQIINERLDALRRQQEKASIAAQEHFRETNMKSFGPDEHGSRSIVYDPALDPEPMLKLRPEDKGLEAIDDKIFSENLVDERRKILKLGYVPMRNKVQDTKTPDILSKATHTGLDGLLRFAPVDTEDHSKATTALYEREVARGVEDGEEVFTGEEELNNTKPQWSSSYAPRKPRYFNRVQMGYEWNKYNQTHYDHDNPPPKVVQGYKFNIFYPDLIDKSKAPTYRILRENGRKRGQSFAAAGEDDTCLIRFIAGPPYEDIAFRIVDKEWDYSAKRERGFKSSFDKGILQLHFQFKKIYYRK